MKANRSDSIRLSYDLCLVCLNSLNGATLQNNDILRRIRYAHDLKDFRMVEIFAKANVKVTEKQIRSWLSKEGDPAFQICSDTQFSAFLNGFITDMRGPSDGSVVSFDSSLTNNMIFKKLRIALNLKADDVLELLIMAGFSLSRHELSSLFRSPSHRHYRECNDQTLRRFLKGMQLKYRPASERE